MLGNQRLPDGLDIDRRRDGELHLRRTIRRFTAGSKKEKIDCHCSKPRRGNIDRGTRWAARCPIDWNLLIELPVPTTKIERLDEEVLEEKTSVAALIAMIPVLVGLSVLEGLFEMELGPVNKLMIGTFDHHLNFGQVTACQFGKTIREPVDLESVILPDTEEMASI